MPVIRVDSYLPIAIDSLKKQTFNKFNCHLLVSHLDKREMLMLDSLVSKDVRFMVHKLNLNGIAFALNYGLNISTSRYIARMDGDDISHPLRFEKQIAFLEENPSYVAVGCRVDLIDQNGHSINKSFKFYENDFEIRRALKYRMPFCHPAMIFRSKTIIASNGYMYGNTAEDHELYLRLARDSNYLFKNLSDNLFSYRRHQSQLTNIKNSKKAFCNIAGFLFTEFLLSYNPIYIVGIIINHPLIRRIRNFFAS
jgi:glycosyltransferase involved in cell wall biosynthesis